MDWLRQALVDEALTDDSVLAVYGIGGLYGFTYLHEILEGR